MSSSVYDPFLEALAYDTPALTTLSDVPSSADDELALWVNMTTLLALPIFS